MNLFYEEDNIKIYHGDSREILPQLPDCDALICDPPYGLGKLQGTTSIERNRNAYDQFEDTEQYLLDITLPIIKLALEKCNGRGLITPGAKCMMLYPRAVGDYWRVLSASRSWDESVGI